MCVCVCVGGMLIGKGEFLAKLKYNLKTENLNLYYTFL